MIAGRRERALENSAHSPIALPTGDYAPWFAAFALTSVLGFLNSPACYAQASTTYSYDSSNRVIQAISSTGAGAHYQYDAARNTLSANVRRARFQSRGISPWLT
jgi:uncharacterized protein RhaS with RHS repeats